MSVMRKKSSQIKTEFYAEYSKFISEADKESRAAAWTGGVNFELCEICDKHRGDIVFSICATKEDAETDPACGQIFILGTTCFKRLKSDLGLKIKVIGGY